MICKCSRVMQCMQAPLVVAGVLSLVACAAALITLPHVPPARIKVATPTHLSSKLDHCTPPSDTEAPVDTDIAVSTPASRNRMVAAAQSDPALRLLLASHLLAAFVNPVIAVRL
jgi:hypothetical protein